jgi:hypothetical protein
VDKLEHGMFLSLSLFSLFSLFPPSFEPFVWIFFEKMSRESKEKYCASKKSRIRRKETEIVSGLCFVFFIFCWVIGISFFLFLLTGRQLGR